MSGMEKGRPADQRSILAVDTSERKQARNLVAIARDAGAPIVKLGLQLSSAESWKWCGKLASRYDRDWVADAKIDDIPTTTKGIVRNLLALDHPPVGITIHTNSGVDSMRAAQELAEEADVTMLGVTHLTSIDDAESELTYGFLRKTLVARRTNDAIRGGIGGLISSAREVGAVANDPRSAHLVTMIPGTRSLSADAHDQKAIVTPEQAMIDGADFLVLGRQVTKALDPAAELAAINQEILQGLITRGETA